MEGTGQPAEKLYIFKSAVFAVEVSLWTLWQQDEAVPSGRAGAALCTAAAQGSAGIQREKRLLIRAADPWSTQ